MRYQITRDESWNLPGYYFTLTDTHTGRAVIKDRYSRGIVAPEDMRQLQGRLNTAHVLDFAGASSLSGRVVTPNGRRLA